jgi:hypothetical protein
LISKLANLIMTAETPDSSHRCASSIAGGLQRQAGLQCRYRIAAHAVYLHLNVGPLDMTPQVTECRASSRGNARSAFAALGYCMVDSW